MRFLAALSIPLASLGLLLAGSPAIAAPPDYAEGVVLVGYRENAPEVGRANVRARVGVASRRALSRRDRHSERLELAKGSSVEAVVAELMRDPNVRYAHPDYRVKAVLDSNDPNYTNGSLWGMYGDTTSPANAFGSQAAEVWAQGYVGSQQVFIGVIDEGIQVTHPDLADNIWTNPHEIAGDGIDNDGNGYIDDVHGWDFFNNDATVFDGGTGDAHGTHVAGTIGGRGGNGQGVVGVNWEVGLISAKFLGATGGFTSDAIAAVDYLTDLKLRHGINIVATSNSWGGGGYSQALQDAINRGGDAGILFIAAAGNDASNTDSVANYPSNYQCTNASRNWDCLVSVASITSTGGLSSFSNYGATTVDIGAPGSSINSTLPVDTYGSYSGTSMATPHVSGAVALCAAVDQTLSAQELRNAVINSAAPTASLSGRTRTGGRLDASAMLAACQPAVAAVSGSPSALAGTATGSNAIQLSWTDGVSGESFYEVDRGNSSCTAFSTVATIAAGSTGYTATGLTSATTYCFRVRAVNRFPSTSVYSNDAIVTTQAVAGPATPTGLTTSSITATSITVGWSAVTGATNYTLQWATSSSGPWTTLATQTGRSYRHAGRTSGTTYYYQVRANSSAGSSAYSAPVSATTLVAAPTAPSNVAASRSGSTVTVTWRDRSTNETGFDIGRQTRVNNVWSATVVVGSVAANTTRFSQAPGTGVYRYYVRSKNATVTSAWTGPSGTQTVP
jgi:subtilisin family serine protease